MHTYLIEMLACPACHGDLKWKISQRQKERIEQGEARCQECAATYPVLEGIGLFLTPADLFYRALVLEERGEYEAARAMEEKANQGIYTAEYLACWQSQRNYVIERLAGADGPVVDLASGRGYLVMEMAQRLDRPIVATDYSPRVLRQNRRRLESFGLYGKISLLAFDARRTPFKDGAVETLTTNVGLPNIEAPGDLLKELRRVTGDEFLAISHFYPEDDEVNMAALRKAGLSSFLFREVAVEAFMAAGLEVEVANECRGKAEPTPGGKVLEGAQIDSFPVQGTTLEWCVLVARREGKECRQ